MNTVLTLLNPREAARHYASGAWRADTFFSLLSKHAWERPAALALRDSRRRVSWKELLEWVEATAETLHRAGLKRGDRVAVWLPSRCESVVAFLACARNGYVCNPSLHQNYTVAEIAGLLERTRAKALFYQAGYGGDAKSIDVAFASEVGSFPTPGLAPSTPPDTDPDKVIYLAFTSGTTGVPKGVMHSDNTLLANGRAMIADWKHDTRTVLLSLSPMSHHIGTVAMEQMMAAGFELVVNDPPAGMQPLDWILESGATYIMGVPTHAIDVLAEARRRGLKDLSPVRLFYMAGSPIPREVAQRFLDMGVTPQNIYGMTENGSHQYTLPSDDARTIVETCGRACAGYETRIFSQENPDVEVPAGTIGEIGTRGALLMLGYFGNQATTEDSFNRGGWFLSGDLGVLDERGCLRIVGRKKDLIIRGGHNIHPARIEDLAHRHPAVQKAAAFGVPDARLGEKACLAVIVREGVSLSPREMLEHLHAAGLSKYDMPEYFLALDAFPLTPSGKILKRELVEWAKSGRIAPRPVRWTEKEQA
ncbi:MAG TPA: class I adenylate-forming enzyme family protein [Burkholderiales bacterium]